MDNSIFLGPKRLNKITMEEWLDFRKDFYANRWGEKFNHLRLGQAFIIHKTERGTIDPELFFQRDDSSSERYILQYYVGD